MKKYTILGLAIMLVVAAGVVVACAGCQVGLCRLLGLQQRKVPVPGADASPEQVVRTIWRRRPPVMSTPCGRSRPRGTSTRTAA